MSEETINLPIIAWFRDYHEIEEFGEKCSKFFFSGKLRYDELDPEIHDFFINSESITETGTVLQSVPLTHCYLGLFWVGKKPSQKTIVKMLEKLT